MIDIPLESIRAAFIRNFTREGYIELIQLTPGLEIDKLKKIKVHLDCGYKAVIKQYNYYVLAEFEDVMLELWKEKQLTVGEERLIDIDYYASILQLSITCSKYLIIQLHKLNAERK